MAEQADMGFMVPKPLTYSIAIFAGLGLLAGLASAMQRGGLTMGETTYTGISALLIPALVMGLIGAAFGGIILILIRTLQMARSGKH